MDAEQAYAIYSQGEEAVVFALLELAKQLVEARSPVIDPAIYPATTSSQVPVDQ